MENSALDRWLEPVEPFLGPLIEVAAAFTGLTGVAIDVPTALFLRARLTGLDLPGRTSAGGSCHLLRASDGWAALNLSRPDDLAAVPALLGILSASAVLRHLPAPLGHLRGWAVTRVLWSAPRGFDTLVSRSPATPVPVDAFTTRQRT